MTKVRSLLHLKKPRNTKANVKERKFVNKMSNRSAFEALMAKRSPKLKR